MLEEPESHLHICCLDAKIKEFKIITDLQGFKNETFFKKSELEEISCFWGVPSSFLHRITICQDLTLLQ